MKQKNLEKAFTLVELLTVIAIIGVLSTIVLASLSTARAKARDTRRISDIKQIQLAIALYQDANGKYPTAIDSTNLGAYMASIPTDPSNGQPYRYGYYPSSNPTYYHLGSSLEIDGNVFGEDRDCNSSGTTCPGGVIYTSGFNGSDSGKCNNADAGAKCYDLTP